MKYRILYIFALPATIMFMLMGCSSKISKETPVPKILKVIHPEIQDLTFERNYPASIEGSVSSEVRAKISGYIDKVMVDEGQEVSRGQILFQIETATLSENAKVARAQVAVKEVEVERLKPLVEKKIISPVTLKTAQAELAQQQSNLNSILSDIAYSQITAPVDGVIGSINYRKGTLVGPTSATPLTVISNIGTVYAYFSMNEKDFISFINLVPGANIDAQIKNLPMVDLLLANGSKYPHKGTVETISGNIDVQTGSVTFRARFLNPEKLIRDGSSGRIVISQVLAKSIVIPYQCTFEQQGSMYVYKVAENDSIYTAKIEMGKHSNRVISVDKGLTSKDRILSEGLNIVRPGMIIEPQDVSFASVIASYDVKFK